jgi:hypothetical protein
MSRYLRHARRIAQASNPQAGGVLRWRTGFEGSTMVGRSFTGQDPGDALSNWDTISSALPWVTSHGTLLEGGTVSIADDPAGGTNKVLHCNTTAISPNYVPGVNGNYKARAQYDFRQRDTWTALGPPNLYDRQFFRWRAYYDTAIRDCVPFNTASPWFSVYEHHAWIFDQGRFTIHPYKAASSSDWVFFVRVAWRADDYSPWQYLHTIYNGTVPFGRWFTMEVFFRYHETDGEFMVAIVDNGEREIVARIQDQTKFGEKLNNATLFKHYHHGYYIEQLAASGGVKTYYDNLEFWSDYPPGYWDE